MHVDIDHVIPQGRPVIPGGRIGDNKPRNLLPADQQGGARVKLALADEPFPKGSRKLKGTRMSFRSESGATAYCTASRRER